MKKASFLVLLSLIFSAARAQEGTDIYLFNFKIDSEQFTLSNGRNITNSPGYDNQPSFLPDGQSLLYTSDDGFGQTDIYRYNIAGASERRMTFTPNSEYSPTITPDGKYYSVIILERDGKQYLWKYPLQGAVPTKVINENPIGYHCWVNDNKVGVFVVGEPNKLKLVEVGSNKVTDIADYPGTTIAMIPDGQGSMSYTDISENNDWKIIKLNTGTLEKSELIKTPKGSQYYTWTPTNILLMGDGKRLYKFDPEKDEDWVEMANLGDYGINEFTRLAVSPKGDMLAVVVKEE